MNCACGKEREGGEGRGEEKKERTGEGTRGERSSEGRSVSKRKINIILGGNDYF